MSLKERVEGNELDLSLNQLREVPVKELAAATKASQLDLSSNLIETLPREFSTLTHLIKIDLSNNRLKELPDNFGNLHNLQYLDLYSNKLVILPLSFCRLKNLQWLDLKNNPLDPSLKTIAGDCLDEKQCRACAKKVVVYMQEIESNVERVRQKLLKIEREKEAKEKAKMEKVLEEQRRLKKLEREKRKAESKAKKEAQLLLEKGQQDSQEERERLSEEEEDMDEVQETSAVRGGNFHTKAMLILLSIALCISFLYLMRADSSDFFSVAAVKVAAQKYLVQVESNFYKALKLVKYYIPIIKEYVLRIVHYYMVTMTHFASQIEHILSLYF